MNSEELKKVEDFFHDGVLDRFEQKGKDIKIWMYSAQMIPKWLVEYPVKVDAENHIRGILHCTNIKKLIVKDIVINEFTQNFDWADILDLEIFDGGVKLLVVWNNFFQEGLIKKEEIIIEAESVYWEHINFARLREWNITLC